MRGHVINVLNNLGEGHGIMAKKAKRRFNRLKLDNVIFTEPTAAAWDKYVAY